MTTKKLIKELMYFGLSRNDARKALSKARRAGVSNEYAFNDFCESYLIMVARKYGLLGEGEHK